MDNEEIKKSNCLTCGCEIDYYQSSISKKNGKRYYNEKKPPKKYCSERCTGKAKQIRKINICQYCNKEFTTLNYMKPKFCSQKCAGDKNQSCKKVKSWEYRNPNTVMKPRKIKIRQCKICNTDTNKSNYCESCTKNREIKRSQDRYVDKKRAIHIIKSILLHLSGGCCKNCGYNKNKSCLVFHHRNPDDKLFTLDISMIMKKNIEDVLNEHSKCDLLCHNCHSDLHNIERNEIASNKKYQSKRNKYVKRKLEYIEKCGGKCIKCNRVFDINNSQSASFHHRSDKEFELNCLAFTNRSNEEIENEGKKCDLMCMNCHMDIPK